MIAGLEHVLVYIDALQLETPVEAPLATILQWTTSPKGYKHAIAELPFDARNATLTVETRHDALLSFRLFVPASFESLVPLFDALENKMTQRFGPPVNPRPFNDEQRHIPLPNDGMPDDRAWTLRDRSWKQAKKTADLYLVVHWPGVTALQLDVALR